MQDAPTAAADQIFPFGIVVSVLFIAAVAIALIWYMKRTRGGDKPRSKM